MPRIEQQVGACEQRANLLHAGRLVEIGRHAALIGVQPAEIAALAPSIAGIDQQRNLARGIAAGWFDLDDFGAEIGEQLAAIAERVARANFHDAQFRQWQLRHFHPTSFGWWHLVHASGRVK